jgi:hypothetical protein
VGEGESDAFRAGGDDIDALAAVVGKGWAKGKSAIPVSGPSVALFGTGEGKTELYFSTGITKHILSIYTFYHPRPEGYRVFNSYYYKSDVTSLHLDSKDTATKVDKKYQKNTILIGIKTNCFDSLLIFQKQNFYHPSLIFVSKSSLKSSPL